MDKFRGMKANKTKITRVWHSGGRGNDSTVVEPRYLAVSMVSIVVGEAGSAVKEK